MSVATLSCAHLVGLQAEPVTIEVDVGRGLYSFSVIGLPDKALDESKDRVIATLKNNGAKNPKTENHKVIVSLSPADVRKEGSHFDLPIALGYLVASRQLSIPQEKDGWFFGELSLQGTILPMKGALSLAELAKKHGAKRLYVPYANKEEAALVEGLTVYGCKTFAEVVFFLGGKLDTPFPERTLTVEPYKDILLGKTNTYPDFKDIKGQEHVKRALQIAAAGGHNIALYGPPGTGKTMLAKAFTGILPQLTKEEALEVTRIYSSIRNAQTIITEPQLRSPHHTSSHVSLVGGGAHVKPGEVTLAHNGVLLLDEFPEFDKRVIESLREPLEEGKITVSRAKGTLTFPASCILIASMNPCPCGYLGSSHKACTCKPGDIDRYSRKLSGPIMDRIDMWVPVLHIDYDTLTQKGDGLPSTEIGARVKAARLFGSKRFTNQGTTTITKNSEMKAKDIETYIALDEVCTALMKKLATAYNLSPRAYHRVLRLARTIADYRESSIIEQADILEAFQYRPKLYQDRL